ncbi:MAG: hypothetical protein LBS21_09740 [Clostridiales bacterium]|jgi:hypothetical protein|nr:hypothetical protein [Clostridiales bacterium]
MILRNCDIKEFIRRINGKKLVCFGVGKGADSLSQLFPHYEVEKYFSYIVDNNSELWGSNRLVGRSLVSIFSPEMLISDAIRTDKLTVLISSTKYADEIISHLNTIVELNNAECYISKFIIEAEIRKPTHIPNEYRFNTNPVIPKLIHYFWFGSKPLPERHNQFISGWKELCPGYDIIEWNINNYDINKFQYTKDAALAGRWSKVATYARFDVVYNYGGICMDTDVEMVKPLDDLLYNTAYIGFGNENRINSGSGFGAVKNFEMFNEMRENYDNTLINPDGTQNLLVNSYFETDFLVKKGLNPNGDFQIIENLTVFSSESFSPMPSFIFAESGVAYATKNTFSVHHYDTSLKGEEQMKMYTSLTRLFNASVLNEKLFINT